MKIIIFFHENNSVVDRCGMNINVNRKT